MNDFLGKYYPSIKQMLHKRRIENLKELLAKEIKEYKKEYHEEVD